MKSFLLLLFLASSCFAREYTAKIISVHDGDTVTATISLGLGISIESSVRLRGINAPELSTGEPGIKARDRLKQLVLGKTVILMTEDKQEREKYGRILGLISYKGLAVNDLMIKEGNAIVYLEK